MLDVAPHRALIAGGGVAGLEALIALRRLAADRVAVTLLTPDADFVIRAVSVEQPFARRAARRHALAEVCADHGADLVRDAAAAVDTDDRLVRTAGGADLPYDSLLIAIGARAEPAFPGAMSFRGQQDTEAMHGLIQDVEGGYSRRIAFVVPSGVTWPLPLYELAFLTAERAASLSLEVELTIVTPEERPLGIFGRAAGEAVERALAEAGIAVVPSTHVREVDHGTVLGAGLAPVVEAERVVAVPRLEGPQVRGMPNDPAGFIPVDEHGRVRGLPGVFAAGDGTTFPIKQGGIAAQQAGAAAAAIARRAGADIPARPFRPMLRAKLLTGSHATYLRQAVTGGAGEDASVASRDGLWWPPTKVAAPFLAPYLERRAG